jgi:hypothetical protein
MALDARIEGLAELLDRQLSVVSREQLLAAGLSDRSMQYRIRSGGRAASSPARWP